MLDAIELLLKEAISLHGETVGPTVIEHAVRQRMNACKIPDMQIYWQHLTTSGYERQELIDAVVVPETWFFRDREAFAAVVQYLRGPQCIGHPIRLLSLPCSTGEEPFSIAMALFDAGFAAQDFRIDAVDVSAQNLVKAQRAIYGRNSFRGADLGFRDRYFDHGGSEHQPNAKVRGQVTFWRASLFEWAPVLGQNLYDVIFCRNLLIYFNREAQERALHRLAGWLAPNGLLLVGPGESGLPATCGFVSARSPRAFAFRKTDLAGQSVLPKPAPRRAVPLRSHKHKSAPSHQKARVQSPSIIPAVQNDLAVSLVDRAAASLAAVQQAADAGRIKQAKEAAAAHLAQFGSSPELFYLMGLIHDASGAAAEAIQCYRKALYLAPNHAESLAHLALLLKSQGDITGAKTLHSRLARIEKRSVRP
jgi:chemotaxis protein methyltransferase WspC